MIGLDTKVLVRHSMQDEAAQSAKAAAVRVYRQSKADFADSLIACSAEAAGCTHTMTFDRAAAKSAGMRLLA